MISKTAMTYGGALYDLAREESLDPNPRPDPVTVEWLAGEMQRRRLR